ncbi:N-acetylmuramoyl-L-alanine amidase [bacterium]|nr:N-acetylmuramoyl-L-alanine amidase [bacterium]
MRLFLWGIIFSSLLLVPTSQAGNIDLVYPRLEDDGTPYVFMDTVRTTFFFGNVSPADARLEVAGRSVEVTSDGAFLAYIPLDTASGTKSLRFALIVEKGLIDTFDFPYVFACETEASKPETITIKTGDFPINLKVIADHAVTKTMPGGTYEFFPQQGTNLVAKCTEGKYFVIELGGEDVTYIENRFVEVDSTGCFDYSVLSDITVASHLQQSTVTVPLSCPCLFRTRLSSDLRELTVSFFHSVSHINKITFEPWEGGVSLAQWQSGGEGHVDVTIRCMTPVEQGYSVLYTPDYSAVEITIRHQPAGRQGSLRGKTIVVDPGHGGAANGSVGPLRTMEKDVVLALGKLLVRELEKRGANVVLTREDDAYVGIYERVDFARENHADFLISLHSNALPDGDNPFLRHGSGTYYYHPGSRRAAETVHRRLLQAAKLRDDGIFYDDLALVRPSDFPSVLVEVAYTMYPEEEKLLRDHKFLQRVAKGLARGIQDFFRMR